MATEEALQPQSLPAAADLSASQYCGVVINSSGLLALAGAGDCDGVLQNKPAAAGRAANYCIGGRTKVKAGGTINPGDEVTTDSTGRFVAAGSGEITCGVCVEGATVGLIGSVIFGKGATIA